MYEQGWRERGEMRRRDPKPLNSFNKEEQQIVLYGACVKRMCVCVCVYRGGMKVLKWP